jgi:methylmalonyl-CoA mutase
VARSTIASRNRHGDPISEKLERVRSSEEETRSQLARLRGVVRANGNVLGALMDAVGVCSLGQITNALFEVGGQYRRDM